MVKERPFGGLMVLVGATPDQDGLNRPSVFTEEAMAQPEPNPMLDPWARYEEERQQRLMTELGKLLDAMYPQGQMTIPADDEWWDF